MAQRKVYKHKFVITVLNEEEFKYVRRIEDIGWLITHGPALGSMVLESVDVITDIDTIVKECVALNNDGSFFTARWEEQDEDEVLGREIKKLLEESGNG